MPRQAGLPREQAEALFAAVADALGRAGARILLERVFGTDAALRSAMAVRAKRLAALDDGVPPVCLEVPAGPSGEVAGVQVHAVAGREAPSVIALQGRPCGRRLDAGGLGYVALSGLEAPEAGDASRQARAMYDKAKTSLAQMGTSMFAVVRTWVWLDNILAWYDAFNRVRNGFYREAGLIHDGPDETHLPASTGIGVGPVGAASCGLDAIALAGERAAVEYRHAAGMQQGAFRYGSAFSRVAAATTPAGRTVYVSGTAAIDDRGKTCHAGDARAQIAMTLTNIRAALADMGCTDADVVHAIAYSKTARVQDVFHREWADLAWPMISVLGDICRDDLLFEAEVTACPGARSA